MSWVRRQEETRCNGGRHIPFGLDEHKAEVGDLWRCPDCGWLMVCDIAETYRDGTRHWHWTRANWRLRLRYLRAGRA